MRDIARIVKDILRRNYLARNSDYKLYLEVCKVKSPDCLEKQFMDVLEHHKEYNLPHFETVRRARQKVQELYPELQSSDNVKAVKAEKEQEFFDFSLAKNL